MVPGAELYIRAISASCARALGEFNYQNRRQEAGFRWLIGGR